MPRPIRIRKIANPPHFKGFHPIGVTTETHPIILNYEEYEAIRLSDYDLKGQMEASMIMNVSRPTFARIYERARRKVAEAFINGQPIIFEGGKVYFDSDWFECHDCGCYFNHPDKANDLLHCALCGSSNIHQYADQNQDNSTDDECVCPQCGYRKTHHRGIPCRQDICPHCNCTLTHKWTPHQAGKRNEQCI